MPGLSDADIALLKRDMADTKQDAATAKRVAFKTQQEVQELKIEVNKFNSTMMNFTAKFFKNEDSGEEGFLPMLGRHDAKLSKIENRFIQFSALFTLVGMVIGYLIAIYS